jgi:hypothetical protein
LLRYFENRHVWLLEPDQSPPKLSPYPFVLRGESHSPLDKGSVDPAASK